MKKYGTPGVVDLEKQALVNLGNEYWNLSPAELVEQACARGEVQLSADGAVVATTGVHTGRSPNDKFIVRYEDDLHDQIWWGKVNQPISPEKADRLFNRLAAYLQGRDVFILDTVAGADSTYRLPIRVVTERAWHSLFAHNLFRRISHSEIHSHQPVFTVIQAPGFLASPEIDGTKTETFIVVDFKKNLIFVGNTGYAGEIKKSIFSVMNFLLPQRGVFPMHCSANIGQDGDVALFFGLSGTGKTTLSSDPDRLLIGDDEHGWSDEGVFNFEGGCYAKTIRLQPDLEPLIWSATHRFGAVLENVIIDPQTRQADFDDDRLTENTRGAYPLEFIPNSVESGVGQHPKNVFFLTADASGVLPPLARLTPEQAMYYFLSGYTSKLAGTEKDMGKEPEATFSTCFGAPFMPLHPHVYADLLGKKIADTGAKVWLVNTGWSAGPCGSSSRIKLPYTRAMVKAALTGALDDVPFHQDPFFGLWIPEACPGVPSGLLSPQSTWEDPQAYARQALALIERFDKNFQQYADQVRADVVTAGPQLR